MSESPAPPLPKLTLKGDAAAAPRRIQAQAVWRHAQQVASAPAAPWLHGEVARRMDERLGWILRQPVTVADWWSHQGGGHEFLRQRYPAAVIHRVEPPVAMSRPAPTGSVIDKGMPWWRRWRVADSATVAPWRDDAPHWSWPAVSDLSPGPTARSMPPVELLWANMMLHWSDRPEAVLAQWFDAIEEDGLLMFSCFGPDTARELSRAYAQAGWGVAAAPFLDMHDIGDALVKAGFRDPVMGMEHLTLSWGSAQACLEELRTLGRNAAPCRHAGLRTKAWRDALERTLSMPSDQNPRPEASGSVLEAQRPHLTFEIVYGHAVRGPSRAAVAPTTEISLDDMRRMVRGRSI